MKAAKDFITIEEPAGGTAPAGHSGADGPVPPVEIRPYRGGLPGSRKMSVLPDGMVP
ncbi:hypothetical protein AB4Y67_17495 [Arthrobacter sp. YAF17]|uniref:hypothetical protein n=1 Tax=Arthrobacter sp. YAF17 TaxID=3233077 RepID=UPI003F91423D